MILFLKAITPPVMAFLFFYERFLSNFTFMNHEMTEKAYAAFDKANSADPNKELVNGTATPKELIYGQRMTQVLTTFAPNADSALKLAARAQHICRWEIPRKDYEMDRVGYLTWRADLKKFHAKKAGGILENLGFDSEITERVAFLLQKKKLKKDQDTQTLEDVICLVFLEHYYEAFFQKHEDEKVIDIVQKTWRKMSEAGHTAALKLNYSKKGLSLIQKALSE